MTTGHSFLPHRNDADGDGGAGASLLWGWNTVQSMRLQFAYVEAPRLGGPDCWPGRGREAGRTVVRAYQTGVTNFDTTGNRIACISLGDPTVLCGKRRIEMYPIVCGLSCNSTGELQRSP
jgi:hypothetical protein